MADMLEWQGLTLVCMFGSITGEDEVEQLLCIMEVMGAPPQHLIEAGGRKKVFFDANNQPTVVPNSRGEAID
jgi:hypothetical protein